MRDVVVVGGGPAGSAVAAMLATEGLDVVLVDRARFPRDKPCGEFLTPACRPILERTGVWRELVNSGLTEVPAIKLHGASGRSVTYCPEGNVAAGYAVRRVILDEILLNFARHAGVEVRERVAARALVREGAGIAGVRIVCAEGQRETLPARLVIGADGTHSIVARAMQVVRPLPRLQRVAIVSHWKGLTGAPVIEMRSSGALVCGAGALGNGEANVTVVARVSEASRIAGRPGDFLTESIAERFPDLAERLDGASMEPEVRTIGCFGHGTRRATGDRAMLVGDAATFVDPFTGEGIYFALRGAQLAADVARDCLRRGDVSAPALALYDDRRNELNRRYLLCGIVQAVVRTPFLMDRVLRRCGAEPLTLRRLMEALSDLLPASEVLRPSFAARLF